MDDSCVGLLGGFSGKNQVVGMAICAVHALELLERRFVFVVGEWVVVKDGADCFSVNGLERVAFAFRTAYVSTSFLSIISDKKRNVYDGDL